MTKQIEFLPQTPSLQLQAELQTSKGKKGQGKHTITT